VAHGAATLPVPVLDEKRAVLLCDATPCALLAGLPRSVAWRRLPLLFACGWATLQPLGPCPALGSMTVRHLGFPLPRSPCSSIERLCDEPTWAPGCMCHWHRPRCNCPLPPSADPASLCGGAAAREPRGSHRGNASAAGGTPAGTARWRPHTRRACGRHRALISPSALAISTLNSSGCVRNHRPSLLSTARAPHLLSRLQPG
jgi:hypothetical protein